VHKSFGGESQGKRPFGRLGIAMGVMIKLVLQQQKRNALIGSVWLRIVASSVLL
jgi:hypothetical protein